MFSSGEWEADSRGIANKLAKRRRSPTEIVTDILKVASGRGTTITALVYRSNSNFIRTRKYVDLMVRSGLLERSEGPQGTYRTTPKGEGAMKALTDANQIVFGTGATATPEFGEYSMSAKIGVSGPASDLGAMRLSFARLSRVCKHKDEKTCKLSRYIALYHEGLYRELSRYMELSHPAFQVARSLRAF